MPKSLTIHKIDDRLAERLAERARQEHLSLNQEVKLLLENALGLKGSGQAARHADFGEFCGTWDDEEARRFEQATADSGKVDEADWR